MTTADQSLWPGRSSVLIGQAWTTWPFHVGKSGCLLLRKGKLEGDGGKRSFSPRQGTSQLQVTGPRGAQGLWGHPLCRV